MTDSGNIMRRILMAGRYDPAYARHAVILEGFQSLGWPVTQVAVPNKTNTLSTILTMITQLPRLMPQVDIVFVPAFNQIIAPVVALMCTLYRKPMLVDYMVGLTDAAEDRQKTGRVRMALFRLVDRWNVTSLWTVTDTETHRAAFARWLKCSVRRMSVLPVGVRPEFLNAAPRDRSKPKDIVVTFVGTYIPFHGVDVILRCASLLKDRSDIRFELIGSGQTYPAMLALSETLGLRKVRLVKGFFPVDQLLPMLDNASIMLGVFGDSEKTRYVIPNKVFEALALGLPMITAESPALSEFFTPGQHLVTVPPGDPQALADAIVQLADSPSDRQRIGAAGNAQVSNLFSPERIGLELKRIVSDMVPASEIGLEG